MTDTELKIYNEASAAAVAGNRTRLARAIRAARKASPLRQNMRYYGLATLTERIVAHSNYIGWPIKQRPNGHYR